MDEDIDEMEQLLLSYGTWVRKTTTFTAAEMDAAWRAFVTRTEAFPTEQQHATRRIKRLSSLLVRAFGPHAAECLLAIAADRAGGVVPQHLSGEQWPRFLAHLRAITAHLGGQAVGQLVWQSGRS